jgi:DNA modification methylase
MARIVPNSLSLCDALILIERLENESVDLVYLDPPWNTEEELSMENDEYLDFIYKVLQQSHRVLRPDGNVFLFSNYEQGVDFHMLARKVFKPENRKIDFIIPRKRVSSSRLSSTYDSLIVYGKSSKRLNTRVKKLTKKEIANLFPFTDSHGIFRKVSLFVPNANQPKRNFEWMKVKPSAGLSWRYSISKLDELAQQSLIVKSENGNPTLKLYATDDDFIIDVGAIWDDVSFIGKPVYPTEQSITFAERVLLVGSEADDVVLDPFCGSGAIPLSCLQLKRQFIASDKNGDGFRLTMERIEVAKPQGTTLTLFDENEVVKLPIVWNKYRAVSPTEEDVVFEILKTGEGDRVEFKESLIWNHHTNSRNPSHLNVLKSLAAFMNSSGGTVILGVKDDSTLLGLEVDFDKANPQKRNSDGFALYLNQHIAQKLGDTVAVNYAVSFYEINERQLCVVNISASKFPVFLENEFYIRNGNQTRKLNCEEFYKYLNVHFPSK